MWTQFLAPGTVSCLRLVATGWVGSLGLLCLAASGCDTSCAEKGQTPILYTEGTVERGDGQIVYSTTPFDGTWLHFPSERQFRLRHDLGTTEYTPVAYVALSPTPAASAEAGEFSHAAGNQAVFESLTETEIVVRNATCAEFYLLVRLEAGAPDENPESSGSVR